jgi:PTS system cellobiose-specific IIC component
MSGFLGVFERFIMPISAKIGGMRHLVVIRDSFSSVMPLILVGSIAVLLNNIWDAFDKILGTNMKGYLTENFSFFFALNGTIWWGTFAVFSLFMVVSVAYRLAKSYGQDGLSASLVALGAFIVNIPQTRTINNGDSWGFIPVSDLGVTSLFSVLIISIIAVELFVKFINLNWTIKMPDSVPDAVSRAFVAMIPAGLTLYLFGIIAVLLNRNPVAIGGIEVNNLILLINSLIQVPFMHLGQSFFTIMVVTLLIPLFWFTGIHGANIMGPVINTIYVPALLENTNAMQQGLELPNIWTSVSWDIYVNFGGVGATLSLLFAIYLASKLQEYKAVAKIGLAPGLFMINEPVMFGLPIVLNPIFFIPFVLNPLLLTSISYFATFLGLVPPASVLIPWTTPPVIGAFLATNGSLSATLLALFNLVLSVIVYLPFVYLSNNSAKKV